VAVTVKAMSAERHVRADHGPYIQAVRRSIEARDIRVAGADIGASADSGRTASLTLRPDREAFAEAVPAEALAFWDEEDGWSLLVRPQPAGSRVSKGLAVLPGPADVAAWVEVALTHPELTPSYEDGPLRARGVADPEFEARLARYPATS
jgi:hypothetical protein